MEKLNRPFPFFESARQRILIPFLFSLFIYIFLMVFQPFGLAAIEYRKPIYVGGFFAITFLVMIFSYYLLPMLFSNTFNPDGWTVRKNILFIFWQILFIGFFNWLYNATVGKGLTEQHNLLAFELSTVAVGIFPIIFVTFYAENYLSRKHELIADDLTHRIRVPDGHTVPGRIRIVSENVKDFIEINLQDFICVQSEGNYVLVYYYQGRNVKRQFIRNSLTTIEGQLKGFDTVKRCHRSYIVNFEQVKRFSGNARNYSLHIDQLDFAIPVSRNFPKEIIESLKS
jgi:hypothetical protein